MPELLSHAGVYPLGTTADNPSDRDSAVREAEPVAPGFPAGAQMRASAPAWGQWSQRSSGYESASSPLSGYDEAFSAAHRASNRARRLEGKACAETARGRGASQIVFGAGAKRRAKAQAARPDRPVLNAESLPPPALVEQAKARAAASGGARGFHALATQIDFGAGPLPPDARGRTSKAVYPGGRGLNYESLPGGLLAPLQLPRLVSTTRATFNVSSALADLVFGGPEAAAQWRRRAAVCALAPPGKKCLNYRSEEKPHGFAAPRQGSGVRATPGWLASAGLTQVVFSGVQRQLRPPPQSFPHGNCFGSSTLELV